MSPNSVAIHVDRIGMIDNSIKNTQVLRMRNKLEDFRLEISQETGH